MTITRISEMFAFKLALYKYWSLPRLGSLLNFIFSHYLHVPRYLLSFNISMKYKLYKEEKYKIAFVFYYFFLAWLFYTYSASPRRPDTFQETCCARHSILTADNWRPPCEWEKFCQSSILSSTAKMTHKEWMSHVCTNIIIFNIHSCRQTIKNDLTVSWKQSDNARLWSMRYLWIYAHGIETLGQIHHTHFYFFHTCPLFFLPCVSCWHLYNLSME